MMAAMPSPTVALVSGDLLFASRLRAALGGGVQVALVAGADVPEVATVFVDLNGAVEARLALIRMLRARPGVRIVGFCGHDQREVRVRAMEHGADEVVTNGSLQQAAQRLVTEAHSHG
jgi:DNA-binding NarL/FixJ family response regulator